MGNTRITFRANGASLTTLQENHYYPFGLEMEGTWQAQVGTENAYQYNCKELNEDFGLNWYDYGARWYDAAIGRLLSVDPLGNKGVNISTYAYVLNNPIKLIDPTGMESESYQGGLSGLADEIRAASKKEMAERASETKSNLYVLIRSKEEITEFYVNTPADKGNFHIIISDNVEDASKRVEEFLGVNKISTLVIDSHGSTSGGTFTTRANENLGIGGSLVQLYNTDPNVVKENVPRTYEDIEALVKILSFLGENSTCVFMTCDLALGDEGAKFLNGIAANVFPTSSTFYFNQDYSDPMNANTKDKTLEIWQGEYGISKKYLNLGWKKVQISPYGWQTINLKSTGKSGDIYLDNRKGHSSVNEL